MKKQRRLQIIFSATVASGQLLSGACAQELQPAPEVVQLRPVPAVQQKASDIHPVGFAANGEIANQSTTVDQELQKLFHANGTQQPSQVSSIQLVQMSKNNAQTTQPKKASRKKPGFFQRMFGSSNNKQIPGVGEPAPPIPQPPKITYRTNTPGHKNTGIPTRTVSHSATRQSTRGVSSGARSSQANAATANIDTNINSRQKPGTLDEFINPFERRELTMEQETLLDLDSLIEEPTNIVMPQKVEAQPVAQVRTVEQPAAQANQQPEAAGPYTGYRVEIDKPAAEDIQPAVERELPQIVSQQERASVLFVEPTQPEARQLPAVVVEDQTAAVIPEPGIAEIPLLEEPEMQIPIVKEPAEQESQINTIPLLEEEVKVSLPAVKQPAQPVELKEPMKSRPVTKQPTHADRVSALESQAVREQQAYRIMARTGKHGFKGFCPVALRDSRELIDSRGDYRAKFGLQTYYFSSPEAKSTFEANPTRYAPAAGGNDIVLLINTSEEEHGSLDFSLWYRDRLYLFRSRETRRIFADNPTKYANQY